MTEDLLRTRPRWISNPPSTLRKQESRFPIRRLEVFKMWFKTEKIDRDRILKYLWFHNKPNSTDSDERFRANIEQDPAYFKGRIFISDALHLHEIYNSKLVEYFDLPTKKRRSKRNRADIISGHDTDLPGTNEEEVREDSDGLKNNSKRDSDFSERTDLPLMGPCAGIYVVSDFQAIVHRDSGEALIDDSYVDYAAPYFKVRDFSMFLFDDSQYWTSRDCIIGQRFLFKVPGLFHSLILDCIVFDDSKLVHVEVKWVMDEINASTDTNIFICGELSVICEGRTSLLFETPPNKAKKVSLGQSIPLLKSVFAVPYHADFEFSANLGRPENVDPDFAFYFPTVNCSVTFPDFEINKGVVYSDFDTHQDAASFVTKHSKLYKCKKLIDGSGGHLEVMATIDIQ